MTESAPVTESSSRSRTARPRLGFLGVGWIGRHRMEALAKTGLAEIAAIADALDPNIAEAAKIAPRAECVPSIDQLLALDLDGMVIATPSALHAEQSIAALDRGLSVFCQKPLARTAAETATVIAAARANNQLLAVDLSYRFTSGIQRIRRLLQSGELGRIFAVDLVFHNAYGPDKPWFYDFKLAGGGCVIDLGIHLVDLALWLLGNPSIKKVTSQLFSQGEVLGIPPARVEDYAVARVDLGSGTTLQLSCSWKLQAGCDAIIGASFYGTSGGAEFHNVNGSFYEFRADRFRGTSREPLASGAEDWGGRAAVDWLKRLSEGEKYNPEVEGLITVAQTLDQIYGRA
ncbi:MAG TPA: Gfo/Idh/MocA family oxidoreductase [Verrucomicrobiae bacterium]|nr:Gfo/Idh/MocA family oxidoreductase [Verrucomicrobiae bacterium]